VKEHDDLKGEALYKKKSLIGGNEMAGRPLRLFDLEKQKIVFTNF